jgi:hypothetical protein
LLESEEWAYIDEIRHSYVWLGKPGRFVRGWKDKLRMGFKEVLCAVDGIEGVRGAGDEPAGSK